ncbi:MAG: carboxypeptidase-like regulatory domain-containing protein [Elusimicrobiota bacterium]|nr:carboxypeptidase-like regulatory domain-containing protein [Elusimicrobiota bacterium]MDH5661703.1 carboxypeptidase-like regulatory domain-containing protein [Elusimicrobiota bacterium]
MKRVIFLSTILILTLSLIAGCKGTPSGGGIIFGKVTEFGTGNPLPGAEITVRSAEGLVFTATADSSGKYSVSDIPIGSYKVSAFLQGYYLNELSEEVQVEKGKKKADFRMVVVGGGT